MPNTKILFSPIGTADPITALGDGPMLHIVRHYQPDKIVLFLSPKVTAYEQDDARYTSAIKKVVAQTGQNSPDVQLIFSNVEDVHLYDIYIQEFSQLLSGFSDDNPEAQILLNTTSGTPAMQQALVAIDAFGHWRFTALQVSTPRKDINKKDDRENPDSYDLELLWECNPDNEANAQNRCIEVNSVNFADLILRENVIALVSDYDYAGAERLARQMQVQNDEAISLINGAAARLALNQNIAASAFGGTDLAFQSGKRIAEYLWTLEVRLANEQWGDFVRALTPAISETFFAILRLALPDAKWLVSENGIITRKIDRAKVEANEQLSKVLKGYLNKTNSPEPFVYNLQLAELISEYCPQYTKQVWFVRGFEENARNLLAHEITSIAKATLEHKGGAKLSEILQILFELNEVKPGMYERISKKILAVI
ncbi:MAG: hypothetical protein LBG97_07975 [Coriobacteriales bacterium]|nr:hypothetical protein [Coriobacteriales bacterium]